MAAFRVAMESAFGVVAFGAARAESVPAASLPPGGPEPRRAAPFP
ncbi:MULTISPECIES: hypothetical protein [unclassified Streptomyces]